MAARPRVLSAMKPTGAVHLGNLEGALRSWIDLQVTHEVFCMIADWHAYTIPPRLPALVRENTREMAIDFLAAGLDPDRCTIFIQSDVKEHAELHFLLSTVTPVSWLERVPTFKRTIEDRHLPSPSYALLGYPVLQAADILLYRATVVPVGRDQLPHIELAREIARRFNHTFAKVFAEPCAHLGDTRVLPGLDGKKMSKSRGNTIDLRDSPESTAQKIASAYTTPGKLRATDAGVPEGCAVCLLRKVYDPTGYHQSWEEDRRGQRGCVANKRELTTIVNDTLAPMRARRAWLQKRPQHVEEILRIGCEKARAVAAETMAIVRQAMAL